MPFDVSVNPIVAITLVLKAKRLAASIVKTAETTLEQLATPRVLRTKIARIMLFAMAAGLKQTRRRA
jgi:ribosomal protein S10